MALIGQRKTLTVAKTISKRSETWLMQNSQTDKSFRIVHTCLLVKILNLYTYAKVSYGKKGNYAGSSQWGDKGLSEPERLNKTWIVLIDELSLRMSLKEHWPVRRKSSYNTV